MTNFPADFTSLVAMAAKLSMSFEQAVFFISNSSARAPAMAPLVMALPVVFMVFMGAIVRFQDKRLRHKKRS